MGELDDILAQLEPSLGPCEGSPTPLQGGITNRNYRARLGGIEYVIRRHGSNTALLGIDRSAERLASETAARLGIAPELVAALPDGLVTRFVPCEPVPAPQLAARVEEVARALHTFHDSGVGLPGRFWVPDLLLDYARLVRDRGGELPRGYAQAVEVAGRIAAALPRWEPRPCHNDLLPGNLIEAQLDGKIMIVDWEYAAMGHPLFDLGNLSVNNDFDDDADERLLAAYDGRPPSRERWAALKLMRLLSDAREAAWAVLQGGISQLDFDFARYGDAHFERLLSGARGASFEEWLASA